jgi:hypothetical protein
MKLVASVNLSDRVISIVMGFVSVDGFLRDDGRGAMQRIGAAKGLITNHQRFDSRYGS